MTSEATELSLLDLDGPPNEDEEGCPDCDAAKDDRPRPVPCDPYRCGCCWRRYSAAFESEAGPLLCRGCKRPLDPGDFDPAD